MSQQDLTADMLTRIRNAVRNHTPVVSCLNNKLNRGIASVLKDEGYINGFEVIDDGRQGRLDVHLHLRRAAIERAALDAERERRRGAAG